MKRTLTILLSFVIILGCFCGCDSLDTDYDSDYYSNSYGNDNTEAEAGDTTSSTTTTITTTTTTTTTTITTTKKPTTTKTTEQMVWIPASGTKYHSKSSCSNMKDPSQISKKRAIELGYSPCKRCF